MPLRRHRWAKDGPQMAHGRCRLVGLGAFVIRVAVARVRDAEPGAMQVGPRRGRRIVRHCHRALAAALARTRGIVARRGRALCCGLGRMCGVGGGGHVVLTPRLAHLADRPNHRLAGARAAVCLPWGDVNYVAVSRQIHRALSAGTPFTFTSALHASERPPEVGR